MRPDETAFLVVWNPKRGGPTVRYVDREKAMAEARRLASANPGVEFFVLESVAVVKREEPVTVRYFDTDALIPF